MMTDEDKILQGVARLQREQQALDAQVNQVQQTVKAKYQAMQELKKEKMQELEEKIMQELKNSMLPTAASHGNQYVLHFGVNKENRNPHFQSQRDQYNAVLEAAEQDYNFVRELATILHDEQDVIMQIMPTSTQDSMSSSFAPFRQAFSTFVERNDVCLDRMTQLEQKIPYLIQYLESVRGLGAVSEFYDEMNDLKRDVDSNNFFCLEMQEQFYNELMTTETLQHVAAEPSRQNTDDNRDAVSNEIDEIEMLLKEDIPGAYHV